MLGEGASKTSASGRRVNNPRKMLLRRGRASSSMARHILNVPNLFNDTRGAGVANCSRKEACMPACLYMRCRVNTIDLVLASRW
jgi:hypothetical protein